MMKLLVSVLCCVLLSWSCSSTQGASGGSNTSRSSQSLPSKVYSVDRYNDGNYQVVELDKEPQPIQGKDQWQRDFYTSLKYPASARERGTQGIVILDVSVDKSGRVTNVDVKQGLSFDCDEAARKAFLSASEQGYFPCVLDGNPVNFKVEVPVRFRVH